MLVDTRGESRNVHADHHHHHHHSHPQPSYTPAFALGISLNLVFVVIEALVGWQVNSLALLADAGHNLSDVAGLALAWAAALVGKFAPNERHTYGWKRASILAAFANATLLLVAMGSLAREAVIRLSHPEPMAGTTVMLVAGIGIVVNSFTAMLFMRQRETDLNIQGAFWHMVADALISAGVVVAGALSAQFAWSWLDPAVSLIVVGIITVGTWSLLRRSARLIFDAVPESVNLGVVRNYLESLPGVDHVHDLHIWAMGTTETALTAHLVMPAGNPDDEFLREITLELHEQFHIEHVTIQIIRSPFTRSCSNCRCATKE